MNIFNSLFKCKSCNELLNDVVLLPCGDSICKRHTQGLRYITCPSCRCEHTVPSIGFPQNKLVNLLVESDLHKFDMGEQYNQAMHSCLLLEKSLQDFNNYVTSPCDYVNSFFDQIKHKIDLKREQVKLENDKKVESLLKDISFHDKDYINFQKFVSSYLSPNEIIDLVEHEEYYGIEFFRDQIVSKKNLVEQQIDESYIKLIDDLIECQKKSVQNTQNFRIDQAVMVEINTIKVKLDDSFRFLRSLKIDNEKFTKMKDEVDKAREFVNAKIKDAKRDLTLDKGYEFESREFNFPDILDKNLLQTQNEGVLELTVSGLNERKLNGVKKDDVTLSEKVLIHGIPFYVGIKFDKNKLGVIHCSACLFCTNEYDFSAIKTECNMKLLHKEYQDMDLENLVTQTFKHFSFGYKRIETLDRILSAYTFDDQCKLVFNVKVLGLQDRKLKTDKPKVETKTIQKKRGFGNRLNDEAMEIRHRLNVDIIEIDDQDLDED